MPNVGIDTICFYTSHYALYLTELAKARGVDPNKFLIGLGQHIMAVPPPDEDIVTMAANAAMGAIRDIDVSTIEMVLFATESGIDQSKAAGIYVHDLLGLPERCRVVELKQACYSGTMALQLALPFLRQFPQKKVLLIASDIARYGLGTSGESSQGCGAVAMVLCANPRILALNSEYGVVTENVMDFWRPNYADEAFVEGKYSSKLYLSMLEKSWQQYCELSGRGFKEHAFYCYHMPVPRLVEKAHQHLAKFNGYEKLTEEEIQQQVGNFLEYGRKIGNSYSASLYIGLASLLDLTEEDLTGKRLGFYSYGSGCVAEFFSGVVQPGYRSSLNTKQHQMMLHERVILNYEDYEAFYSFKYPRDGSSCEIPRRQTGRFRLAGIQAHKRIYEKLIPEYCLTKLRLPKRPAVHSTAAPEMKINSHESTCSCKVLVPGKLILSGEHAVVYGQPALAMAVNRYVTATATPQHFPLISFDLSDLAYQNGITLNALEQLKRRIKRKYQDFMRGEFTIRDVLHKPFELAQFALSLFLETLNFKLTHGVKIRVQSDIPIGCGMGSSAATILSIVHAIAHHLRMDLPMDLFYRLGLEAENMQHGYSSGLDVRVSLNGGCIYMKDQHVQPRSLPTFPMYLVNTGMPETSTGECVTAVAAHFKKNGLKDDFAAVTDTMDMALQKNNVVDMVQAVRANHQLLSRIGVVPHPIQDFVQAVEHTGGAAKICGAGAVAGNKAGVVLALTEEETALRDLCARYHYTTWPMTGEARGVHIV